MRFVDATAEAGIDFVHTSGRSGRKYGVETIGSGAAFFDYNRDGWMDLYVVNGADLPGYASAVPPQNALYRNDGGHFAEVGASLGVADAGYGMGASAGDYDNDGDADLFVANFGRNRLYRNEGAAMDWIFVDVTVAAGIEADQRWSTGSSFADYDLDGDLDLYVANYLRYEFERGELSEGGTLRWPRRHLAPTEYPGERNALWRNDGGRFVDVTAASGLLTREGRELGAVFFDYDLDGDPDLFQGNDATPNFLWRNDGGRFAEVGLVAGVAYNAGGKPEGTMGVDVADGDGDGLLDLAMTNFQWESNTLYRNAGDGMFADESLAAGIAANSLDRLAFGINFLDADNDGDPDLYVANGHIDEDIDRFDPQAAYGQSDQLYLNDGRGRFADASVAAGVAAPTRDLVGRGSAVADYDNDGDLDIFLLNTGQRALLWRNDTQAGHYLALMLEGRTSNRDGYGARVVVRVAGRTLVAEKRSAASYLSQNDARMFFGLGSNEEAEQVEDRVAFGYSPSFNGCAGRAGVASRRAGCERTARGGQYSQRAGCAPRPRCRGSGAILAGSALSPAGKDARAAAARGPAVRVARRGSRSAGGRHCPHRTGCRACTRSRVRRGGGILSPRLTDQCECGPSLRGLGQALRRPRGAKASGGRVETSNRARQYLG